jgi:hypothetical protein
MTYTYQQLINDINQTQADTADFYGDFGFEADITWNGNTVEDMNISWPNVNQCRSSDCYAFSEALSAFCFALAPFIGVAVED